MRIESKRFRRKNDAVVKVKQELQEYCGKVVKSIKPLCIILYGSRAKGTFTPDSDADIIVISNNLDQDFLTRIRSLIDLNSTALSIEPLGYTELEFTIMLESFRLTALDAVSEGIALYGEDYFNHLKERMSELERMGVYKGKISWHIPAITA
ncbi:MAG: nucleotidyltransferase domain-containing protein [Candidatus Methanoperedens sp.]|nr:nucleotidyltransferase domain-containing protein [Candidatus Methanoperedens sp.]MCE8427868.1 nucleotidyltransferase domain-containing protein [Candidatus Methanoperedens sp.]